MSFSTCAFRLCYNGIISSLFWMTMLGLPLISVQVVGSLLWTPVAMLRDWRRKRALQNLPRTKKYRVVIIGAGFSGLSMGYELGKLGIPYVIYEKSRHLGGTWYDNHYPGCACDIPAHLYALSWAPNVAWTKPFADQAEILEYMERVADRYDIIENIRFGVKVEGADWDAKEGVWKIKTTAGNDKANALVSGVGCLHIPVFPSEVQGIDKFKGPSFHSAQWRDDVDLKNKSVTIIGSAASAIQIVPKIAPIVKQLNIFQRTPNHVLPRPRETFPFWMIPCFKYVPLFHRIYRQVLFWRSELLFLLVVSSPSSLLQRLCKYMFFRDLQIRFGPEKAGMFMPTFPVGCKRLLLSNDWYETLLRSNVRVIPEGIKSVEETGVISASSGELVTSDVIIYATGFKPTSFSQINIRGNEGKSLKDMDMEIPTLWGIVTPDFPNFFMLLGPNTTLGHSTVVYMIECQANYIARCMEYMIHHRIKSLEPTHEAVDEWFTKIQKSFHGGVWNAGCRSWYQNAKGFVYTLWPKNAVAYYFGTIRPNLTADFTYTT